MLAVKKTKLILFDCYKTLIYKKDLDKKFQDFFVQELGQKMPRHYFSYALDVMYHRHKFQHPKFLNAREHANYYQAYNKEQLGIIGVDLSDKTNRKLQEYLRGAPYEVYSDVRPALISLKKAGYTLGVAANWTETLRSVLATSRLDDYFDFIWASDDGKIAKPNPLFFKQALANLKDRGSYEIYYVGDDYELDIEPARRAGLKPILLDRTNAYPQTNTYLRIANLKNLKDVLAK